MWRSLVAVAVAVAIAPLMSACTSFGAAAESDAGPAPASDGGIGDAGADAGLTFCQTNASAIFCDDFEAPGRVISTPAPWDLLTGSMAESFSIGDGFQSTSGLRVAGVFPPNEDRFIKKAVGMPNQRLRGTFRFRLSKLTDRPNEQAQVGFAGFEFADDKHVLYVLFNSTSPPGPTGFVSSTLVSPASIDFFERPPVGFRYNEWMSIQIELEPGGATNDFRLFMGTTLMSKVTLPAGQSPTFFLGARGLANGGEIELAFDDVLVTTF